MSRDPNRIEPIIKLIYRIWKKNPDLRLGQLFGNIHEELYYIEDEALETKLRAIYNDNF